MRLRWSCLIVLLITAAETALGVDRLSCEYATDPLGIDVAQPRFSWILHSERRGGVQAAYQIMVAGSAETLGADVADKWDSGHVESDQSVHVVYQGKKLSSGEKCWWKVRVWDQDGNPSPYSKPGTLEMGLLRPGDWEGKWIAMGDAGGLPPAPPDKTGKHLAGAPVPQGVRDRR